MSAVVVEFDFEHMNQWYDTAYCVPEDEIVVLATDSGGGQTQMLLSAEVWYEPDYASYIDYVPTRWMYAEADV